MNVLTGPTIPDAYSPSEIERSLTFMVLNTNRSSTVKRQLTKTWIISLWSRSQWTT